MAQRRGTRPAHNPQQAEPVTLRERESHRDKLANRLSDGYTRIEEATLNGRDVAAWEAFWMSLLKEYEDVCDDLEKLATYGSTH